MKKRIISYDVFRGILIIGMIIFHVLCNFYNGDFNKGLWYWIPVGFMMFLGIIIGQFLRDKSKKVLSIGIKLLLIFLTLNIPNFISNSSSFTFSKIILGNQNIFSFEILFPMSVLILISLVLSKIASYQKHLLVLIFIFIAFFDTKIFYSYNALFFLFGTFGYFLSSVCNLDSFNKNTSLKYFSVLIIGIISFVLFYFFPPFNTLVIFQILLFYFLSSYLFKDKKFLAKIGSESLFIYVFHIVLLRLLAIYIPKLENIFLTLIFSIFVFFMSWFFVFIKNFVYKLFLKYVGDVT